jgi:hypothetical protein
MLEPLFAWSWTGHGLLTAAALTVVIARWAPLASTYLLTRLKQILLCQPSYDLALNFSPPSFAPPTTPVPATAIDLQRLFGDLPLFVQKADIHAGNIPNIPIPVIGILSGQYLDPDGQVRHYMRSRPNISPINAHRKSSHYVWKNLYWSWWSMRKGINGDPADKGPINDFQAGICYLSLALHTIEDSYAPGHVFRQNDAAGTIMEVHIWDDRNKRPDPSRGWLGHEYYDNDFSDPMFGRAKNAATALLFAVLSNLENDEGAYLRDAGNAWNYHFQEAILDNPFSDQMNF